MTLSSRKTRKELEAELKRLQLAADKVRLMAYGTVTANDANGTVPPDQTIYLYAVLGELDEALGLKRTTRETTDGVLKVSIPI